MTRLRHLLLAWLLVPTLLLWTASIALTAWRSLHQSREAFDRTLLGAALVIAERVEVSDGEALLDLPVAALQMLQSPVHDRIYYRVSRPDGRTTLTGYEDLPAPPAPPGDEPRFYDAEYKGQRVRVAAVARRVDGGTVIVQVAETDEARRALSWLQVRDAALLQLLLIVVAALFIALGVRRGLSPLKRLRDEVRQRSAHDLTPIEGHRVPREVVPLIDAINQHTQRQRELTDAQARFVANASHQLRTPLTLLQAQLDLAGQEQELPPLQQALQRVQSATESMRRLVEQLLALARSESGPLQQPVQVDLATFAQTVSFELLPLARERHIDLGFEPGPGNPVVQAQPALLHEALANLVHNALNYTPAGGQVTVRARVEEGCSTLEVCDTGPGIAPELRERVLERFFRATRVGQAGGSGLGLAIAKEVCDRHGATLVLDDGPAGRGLRAAIVWPAAAGSS